MADQMKAVVVTRFGGAEAVELHDVSVPKVEPHQVRVRVHATAVNPPDSQSRRGDDQPHPWRRGRCRHHRDSGRMKAHEPPGVVGRPLIARSWLLTSSIPTHSTSPRGGEDEETIERHHRSDLFQEALKKATTSVRILENQGQRYEVAAQTDGRPPRLNREQQFHHMSDDQ
ncbi:hypothetical protein [Arthrobacter crusticola]|uniref:hypothetical protein n=1 Tax=Arthrobacter crusticola TaxID=2547960 RepID=UPI001C88D5E9|nr:hypothetical protein [Arthrobacter crusticola]